VDCALDIQVQVLFALFFKKILFFVRCQSH
jgi:hypothetical protein